MQTTLRSTLGQFELDQLLSERDTINQKLQHIIDEQTDAWGIRFHWWKRSRSTFPPRCSAIMRQAEASGARRSSMPTVV
jgi:regulator of protease activity HflC (stomatin/prohibitin superfamily)